MAIAFDAWYGSQLTTDELKATFLNIAGADMKLRQTVMEAFQQVAGRESGDGVTFIAEDQLGALLDALPAALRRINCHFEEKDKEA